MRKNNLSVKMYLPSSTETDSNGKHSPNATQPALSIQAASFWDFSERRRTNQTGSGGSEQLLKPSRCLPTARQLPQAPECT